MKNKTS